MYIQLKQSDMDSTALTIFTIPESFVHIDTGKKHPVTPEMFRFMHKHIEQNDLIHAFMTAIYHNVHGNNQVVELGRLESKVEEVLQLLKEQKTYMPTAKQVASAQEDLPDHLDELLEEFGG